MNFWLDNWCANDNLVSLLGIQDISLLDTSLKVLQFITSTENGMS